MPNLFPHSAHASRLLNNSTVMDYIGKIQPGLLPNHLNTRMVCKLSNHLPLGQDFATALHELNGKTIGLMVTDLNKLFTLKIENGLLCPHKNIDEHRSVR